MIKRFILCMAALLVLAACNNKSEQNNAQPADANEAAQSEMPAASTDDAGQRESSQG